jgi:acid phosphatase (class A)
MKLNSVWPLSPKHGRLLLLVPSLCLLLCTSAQILAADKYIATGKFDSIALLAPPPIPGSAEQAADLASARAIFKGRTPTDEARALKHLKLTIFNFTPAVGDFFQPGKFPRVEQFFEDLKQEAKEEIFNPKDHWRRTRPYDVDKDLNLGEPEKSFSYPSGHSTQGMLAALVLAEIFPEKREALLAIGREMGWDRVIIGKHYPTDVYAGRVLAQNFVQQLLATPSFQKDLTEVKAELRAAAKL